jgi:hypothetical protein
MFRMLNAYLQLQLLVDFFLVLVFLAFWGPWVLLEVLVMMLIFVS